MEPACSAAERTLIAETESSVGGASMPVTSTYRKPCCVNLVGDVQG
jgi:hypothetical protein